MKSVTELLRLRIVFVQICYIPECIRNTDCFLYTPRRRDILWYGAVCPSVCLMFAYLPVRQLLFVNATPTFLDGFELNLTHSKMMIGRCA
jgi:hypothetical protein